MFCCEHYLRLPEQFKIRPKKNFKYSHALLKYVVNAYAASLTELWAATSCLGLCYVGVGWLCLQNLILTHKYTSAKPEKAHCRYTFLRGLWGCQHLDVMNKNRHCELMRQVTDRIWHLCNFNVTESTLIRQGQAQGTENRGDTFKEASLGLGCIQTKSGSTGQPSVLLFILIVGGALQL